MNFRRLWASCWIGLMLWSYGCDESCAPTGVDANLRDGGVSDAPDSTRSDVAVSDVSVSDVTTDRPMLDTSTLDTSIPDTSISDTTSDTLGSDASRADAATDRAADSSADADRSDSGRDGGGLQLPTWRRLQPTHTPGHRYNPEMGYDVDRDVTLLIGGSNSGGQGLSETWAWNGADWRDVTVRGSAAQVEAAVGRELVFDETMRRLISASSAASDLYSWDGIRWERSATITNPFHRSAGYSYDRTLQALVAIGGDDINDDGDIVVYTKLSRLDGTTWRQVANEPVPGANPGWTVAYIPTRGVYWVLDGVGFGNPTANRVWQWDGTSWQQLGTIPGGPRYSPIWTYLPTIDRLVMVSGSLQDRTIANDTWLFDGSEWTQLAGVSPRWSAMGSAFDSQRQQLVAYGGQDEVGFSVETWVLE